MLPYFIALAVFLMIANFAFKKNGVNVFGRCLLFLGMTLFAGLRNRYVGTDSGSYAVSFEDARYLNSGDEVFSLLHEPGFYLLQRFVASYSHQYNDLFIVVAAIACFFTLKSIRKLSCAPVFSLFVFVTLGYYTFMFNAARQGIAAAIYMMSFQYLHKRDFKRYTAIVLLATLFHVSCLVAIPLYFVFTKPFSRKLLAVLIIAGLLIGLGLPTLIGWGTAVSDKLAGYLEGTTGGYVLTLFYVLFTIFFIYERRNIRQDSLSHYDVYLGMMIIGSMIYLVVSFAGVFSELTRFAAYFQVGSLFLWAEIRKKREQRLNSALTSIAVIGHLVFFAITLSRFGDLIPYELNMEYISNLF